jgi:hypothetical protein
MRPSAASSIISLGIDDHLPDAEKGKAIDATLKSH